MLKFYPDRPAAAGYRVLADLLVAAFTGAAVYAGFEVHHLVLQLQVIAGGLVRTGNTFNGWISVFRGSVPGGVPFLGDYLRGVAGALQRDTGDQLIGAGHQADEVIGQLALALGVAVAVLPILAVTLRYLLWRLRDMREMGAALAFVRAAEATGHVGEARALLAFRAVATLRFTQLMGVSRDPVSDLAGRRYDGLADAMLRQAGLDANRLPLEPPARPVPPAEGGARRLDAPRPAQVRDQG